MPFSEFFPYKGRSKRCHAFTAQGGQESLYLKFARKLSMWRYVFHGLMTLISHRFHTGVTLNLKFTQALYVSLTLSIACCYQPDPSMPVIGEGFGFNRSPILDHEDGDVQL
jgi:hypothetical protein